jgi:hypothetical protein
MGAAQVSSPNHQGITETVVPVSSLVAFLLLAALLGLISASWRPAPESPSTAVASWVLTWSDAGVPGK